MSELLAMLRSWRTTALGVLMIVGAVSNAAVELLNGHQPDWQATALAIIGGIGMLFAKDATVTGGVK